MPERHRSPVTMPGHGKGRRAHNKGHRHPDDVLTPEELERVLAEMPAGGKIGPRNRAAASLMARAGLKIGQVMELRPTDYDRERSVVKFRGRNGTREVHIDQRTRDLLDEWMKVRAREKVPRTQRLFTTISKNARGTPLGQPNFRNSLAAAAERAGVEKWVTPTSLKRTYDAAQTSRSTRIVADLAAHIDEPTFAVRYPRAYEHWKDAYDLFDRVRERRTDAVGHSCCSAVSAFADELTGAQGVPPNPSDSKAISTALNAHLETQEAVEPEVRAVLKALVAYWGRLIAAAHLQRHEEDRLRRGETPLTAEDSRRLVFQTLILMVEIDRACRS